MTLFVPQPGPGSLDDTGAGDRDLPYRFGRRPRASAPYPFSTRQYVRLLVLRGRVRDTLGVADGVASTHPNWRHAPPPSAA